MTTEWAKQKLRRAAALLAALTALWLPAVPAASNGAVVDAKGCTAVIADYPVPPDRVEPLIPDQFTLALDQDGNATIFAYAEHCRSVTLNGVAREVIWAAFRVDLTDLTPLSCNGEPQDSEERDQCKSESLPRVHLDTYQFFIAYNDPDLVRLFQDVGATPKEAVLVEDLVFDLRPDGTFLFKAPAPTPSPFKITALVGTPETGPFTFDHHEWGAVPRGLFKVGDPNDVSAWLGPAQGTLHAEAGSDMAKILCATEVSWIGEVAGIVSFDSQFAVHAVDKPKPSSTTEPKQCPKTTGGAS